MHVRARASLGLCLALAISCSSNKANERNPDETDGGPTQGQVDSGVPPVPDAGGTGVIVSPPPPVSKLCGDGKLSEDEACDDGNTNDGDGCSANCRSVGPSFSCNPPGVPCHIIARCGDGIVTATEPCDDGNAVDRDGCSARCKLEPGFKCQGQPSVCTATTCGDRIKEGTEGCDDGNIRPYDGCSANCQAEPKCPAGSCTSDCGDGLIIGEDCDDGNTINGDGCSSTCRVEPGFQCMPQDAPCEMVNGACILRVQAIFRDFAEAHSDFGVGCTDPAKNLVQPMLNAQGKPVLVGASQPAVCITSAASFAEWYTDGPNRTTVAGSIVLYANGRGGFVNRWGPNGEQWEGVAPNTPIITCGNTGTACATCMPPLAAGQKCFDPCTPQFNPGQSCAATPVLFDGNPMFFPVDSVPSAATDPRFFANIPPAYGWNWPYENQIFPGAGMHNFFFTTEVHYWFKYSAAASATLTFAGDDDVWVFLNSRLAVDLGGLHVPLEGAVTISAATAPMFGLVDGRVYEISVFHAERKPNGSSFQLTLQGFQTARSDCSPICGDGVVSQGEECDDGMNNGGYGECAPGCVLGPYCGDGIKQDVEDCDDGNRLDNDGCGSACRILDVR